MTTNREQAQCETCGSHLDYRGNCASCTNEYELGKLDADKYHTDLAIGGEDYAALEELRSEYGHGAF